MTFGLTIAGVAKELRAGSLRIRPAANRRGVASFAVVSKHGTYRPALDANVIITVDGVRLWAGLIDKPSEHGLLEGATLDIETIVNAVDYTAYAERRLIVDGGFPAGTSLKDALISLASWLTPYGVTLDGSQVTGPTLPEIVFPLNTVRDALDAVMSLTAASGEPFVWEIDEFKVLRAFQPSTAPAPFDILTNAPGYVAGDITVEPSREGYANRVYAIAAPKEEKGRFEHFDGDGSTSTFTLQYTPYEFRGVVWMDGIEQPGSHTETLNRTGDSDAASWTYDAATNTITRNALHADGSPAGPPGVGQAIDIGFDGTYAGRAMAQDASVFTDPWEKAIQVEDVDSDATLQEMADAALALALQIPLLVKYRTREATLRVGQSQTINVPARAINETGLITDLSFFDQANRLWCDVTVLTGASSNLKRGYKNTVQNWSGTAASSGSINIGAAGASSAGPAGPETAVQVKRNGAFYGSAALTFDPATNCLIAGGGGSSITATSPESCFLLAYDGHITD